MKFLVDDNKINIFYYIFFICDYQRCLHPCYLRSVKFKNADDTDTS